MSLCCWESKNIAPERFASIHYRCDDERRIGPLVIDEQMSNSFLHRSLFGKLRIGTIATPLPDAVAPLLRLGQARWQAISMKTFGGNFRIKVCSLGHILRHLLDSC